MNRVTRTIGIIGLVGGPVGFAVASALQWALQGGFASPAEAVAGAPALFTALAACSVFGPMLWLAGMPLVASLAHRDHGDPREGRRGRAFITFGVWVTAVGLAAAIGHVASYFSVAAAVGGSGVSGSSQQAMLVASDGDPVANTLLVLFLIGFIVGPVVLTIGLRAAGLVALWVPITAIIAGVANFVDGPIALAVQVLAVLATWAAVLIAGVQSGQHRMPRGSAARIAQTALTDES